MNFADLLTPIRAAVTPLTDYTLTDHRSIREDTPEQELIRRYDRHGPGIVGAMLDIPSGLAAHVELTIEKRVGVTWTRVENPAAAAILNLWRGENSTPTQLLQRMIREFDAVGEMYSVLHRRTDGSWFYSLEAVSAVTVDRQGRTGIRSRPDAKEGSRWYTPIDANRIAHILAPDPEWSGLPWSPMLRAMPYIETYRKAMRTVGRNLDSQLAMNGIMWAQATAAAASWPDAMKAWARKAVDDDTSIESVAPFALVTESEPKWIDVGRSKHTEQLAVADAAVAAIARTSDLPTKMVTEGPGAANHWNEIAISDWIADYTMHPRLERAANAVTCVHFRPWAAAMPTFDDDPNQYRVWFDDRRLRGETDNTDQVVKLHQLGVATRTAAAESVGLRPDQVMALPSDVSEYEAWSIGQGHALDDPATSGPSLGDGSVPDGPPVAAGLSVVDRSGLIPR